MPCKKGKTGYNIKHSIEDVRLVAESKGGKCLSEKDINIETKLLFECEEGHEFWARPSTVLRGHWCPICSDGISERYCRKFFEKIFNNNFPKRRPRWLLSDKGYSMELDGFYEELKLAFEYQGGQHFSDDFFKGKKRKKTLKDIQKYDQLKKSICENNQVTLITVPHNVTIENMQKYIVMKCLDSKVPLPNIIPEIDYHSFNVYSPKHLTWVKEYAFKHGGECLSERYHGRDIKLVFKCAKGHIFAVTPHSLKSMKSWCPTCAGRPPYTLKDMQNLAEKRGGRCLSEKYINSETKMIWQCKNGHLWEATTGNVVYGDWCRKCANRRTADMKKLDIKEMQYIAHEYRGKCLSEHYINANTKLKWECSYGHVWEAKPGNVKGGHWCLICSRMNRNYKKYPHKHLI